MNLKNPLIAAGLVDDNVEFFVSNNRAFALYNGTVTTIDQLPEKVLDVLERELFNDLPARKALKAIGVESRFDRLEIFARCRYGAFNNEPDIENDNAKGAEYWECGLRGKCAHEGKLCQALKVQNGYLTKREIQVVQLIAAGKQDKEIADSLGISNTTIPVFKKKIQEKTGCRSKVEIAVLAINKNLYASQVSI